MSLFKRKSKNGDDALTKNVLNIAILDLRSYSADGLKNVRKLNSAVVILPKEPDEEIMEAYGGIACKNVATEIFAENDAQVHMINGVSEVDCAQCNDHDIYMINGLAAFRNAKERTANIIINGLAVYEKNANLNFLNRHGKTIAVDFEIERVKILADKASVEVPDSSSRIDEVETRLALDVLSVKERELLLMKTRGYTSEEIGKEFGISASAARTRLQKIRKKLAAKLVTD